MPPNYRRETCEFERSYQIFVLKYAAKLKQKAKQRTKQGRRSKKVARGQKSNKIEEEK